MLRTDLERAHQAATIVGVVVALATGMFAAYTFAYSTNVQAEDAAYRVLSEHMSLRVEQTKDLEDPHLVARLAQHPEYLNDTGRVSSTDYAVYVRVAEHGLVVAEQLFRTRGSDEVWRSMAERMVFDYRAQVLHGGGLACETYEPEFIQFVRETLDASQAEVCGPEQRRPWWQRVFGG